MIRRLLLIVAAAVAAAPFAFAGYPAFAANQTITAAGGTCVPPGSPAWQNANVTISVGDTVTWTNCGSSGNHYLYSSSGGWCLGNGQSSGMINQSWTYACKFTAPGSYTYYCGYHGPSMAGTVTVQGTSLPPTPAPTHSQAAPPPPPATHAPAPAMTQPAPAQTTAAAAPGQVALAPSPSPSASEASPSPSAAPVVHSAPASSGGGGSPLPVIAVVVVLAALGGGGYYWYRSRQQV